MEETEIKKFDKLIRDLIPVSIIENGKNCKVEVCNNEKELLEYTKDKIHEEINELLSADAEHVCEEAADVIEIISFYCEQILKDKPSTVSWEIMDARDKKLKNRGGFNKHFILKEVY